APRDIASLLDEVGDAAALLRGSVTAHFERRGPIHVARFSPHITALRELQKRLEALHVAESRWLEQVTKKLGVELQPAERAWALLFLAGDLDATVNKLKERRRLTEIDRQIELLRGYLDVGGEVGQLGVTMASHEAGVRIAGLVPGSAAE